MELTSPPAGPNTATIRRNPPRRARPTPSTHAPPKPSTATNPPQINSFPINDILAIEIPNPKENLKVYLRIRPPKVADCEERKVKARGKVAWPKNPAKRNVGKEGKRKSGGVCVSVNDERSVTVSPPAGLGESKRVKSEVYEGFEYVFSAESTQSEVYGKMVQPLVDDFLGGKSGMLAAMGPTGSGKTHTVFGSPREPGMVPLLLRQISEQMKENSSRSFYISMFEICSERGKGERLIDLSPDGTEISMQQTSIKGLQEMAISDIREAESLIARGMLRRATATTNSNSQSSRSQCIINIRSVVKNSEEEEDIQANSTVLSIVDLAGAEREKKTGNQGARLFESNFINNTSMVFGLCLRSLFEHQKNPKKPLQKHFQNSMLTRYLRDYLEGKKRMALILTIKPGEEDYLDASFLLRQASPYMKIKFANNENLPNFPSNKRQCQAPAQAKVCKKMKFSEVDASEIEEGKTVSDEGGLSQKDPGCDDFTEIERSNHIMQKFARAIWNVLKQHNKKLQGAQCEILSLKASLKQEKTRSTALEEELKKVKSLCTCSNKHLVEAISKDSNADLVNHSKSQKADAENSKDGAINVSESECNRNPEKCLLSLVHDDGITSDSELIGRKLESSHLNQENLERSDIIECQKKEDKHPCTDAEESLSSAESCSLLEPNQLHEEEDKHIGRKLESSHLNQENPEHPNITECQKKEDKHPYTDAEESSSSAESCSLLEPNQLHKEEHKDLIQECESSNPEYSKSLYQTECQGKDGHYVVDVKEISLQSCNVGNGSCSHLDSDQRHNDEIASCTVSDKSSSHSELNQRHDAEAVFCKDLIDLDKPERKLKSDASLKSVEKPKRRLLPASSVLLKDINVLDVENETEKPKGKKGTRKQLFNDIPKSQGNASLMRLLQLNVHP